MTNSIIRNARLSDAVRMAELSETLGYPVESGVFERRLERLLSLPEHLILVAESRLDGVAGWIHATEQEILEVGRAGEIVGLVVASDQRGNGIGRLLVEQIEQWALARGLDQISVRSNVLRMESHPFYERLGYARIKTQHVYRKNIRQ